MEQSQHNEPRETALWLIGLPLAVLAPTLTLLGLLSAINEVDHSSRNSFLSLLLVPTSQAAAPSAYSRAGQKALAPANAPA